MMTSSGWWYVNFMSERCGEESTVVARKVLSTVLSMRTTTSGKGGAMSVEASDLTASLAAVNPALLISACPTGRDVAPARVLIRNTQ
jgi:hypothetical protein